MSVAPSATPLPTSETVERLTEAGVQTVSLSLDGSDAAGHDALRGVAGSFDRTIAAAPGLRANGLRFQTRVRHRDPAVAPGKLGPIPTFPPNSHIGSH